MITIATLPRSGHHWLMNMTQDACKLPTGWHCDTHLGTPSQDCLVAKTHDFDLQCEQADVVQWRDPIHALCSWYELGVKHGNWNDSEADWRQWSVHKIQFAAAFYLKHVKNKDNVIRYDQLCAKPSIYVHLIAKEIGRPVVRKVDGVQKYHRQVNDFRYYDTDFFVLLETIFEELTQ